MAMACPSCRAPQASPTAGQTSERWAVGDPVLTAGTSRRRRYSFTGGHVLGAGLGPRAFQAVIGTIVPDAESARQRIIAWLLNMPRPQVLRSPSLKRLAK